MPDSPVLHLYDSLRQTKQQWAVFLGAGASYDYGIPTMAEIANILRTMVKEGEPKHGLSDATLNLLRVLCPENEGDADWDIEALLTRLHQLLDAVVSGHPGFSPVTTVVGGTEVDSDAIRQASEELVQFMAAMCDLGSPEHTNHGSGQVVYLSDFFLAMSAFGTPGSRLMRVFTTNIDLCVEAALVRLSQRSRADRKPDLVLVDGFESAILPTYNMGRYAGPAFPSGNRCPVYYWKLHGSVDWTYAQPLAKEGTQETEGFSDQSIIIRRIDDGLRGKLARCEALCSGPPDEDPRIVIFPTPAKYSQTYTFPYMDLFEAFRRTLEEIELLICVGTSFPDQHIRSAIRSFVERDNTLLFLVDPTMTNAKLRACFGDSRSIQPVINMGFEWFVQEFRTMEAVTADEPTGEREP